MKGQEAFNILSYYIFTPADWRQQERIKKANEIVEKSLKALEIIKPLCEVVETPVKKFRYLKVNGVVVYTFKTEEEFDILKEVLE